MVVHLRERHEDKNTPHPQDNIYPVEFLEQFDLHPQRDHDADGVSAAITALLTAVGEDPSRQGLVGTPKRVARMYRELLNGYLQDPQRLINGAIFDDVDYREMVIVKDIEFFSTCEHHMLPFWGKAHVGYIPCKRIIGLSKIPRIVDTFARRLQIQERLTQQIAKFLDEVLQPVGVAVVLDGAHFCSIMRGVKKSEARMTTSAMRGAFRDNGTTRAEFLSLIARP